MLSLRVVTRNVDKKMHGAQEELKETLVAPYSAMQRYRSIQSITTEILFVLNSLGPGSGITR